MEVITGLQDRDKKQLTVGLLAAAIFTRGDKSMSECIDEAIVLAPKILGLRGEASPVLGGLPNCPACEM
jgi:hypothetical protein